MGQFYGLLMVVVVLFAVVFVGYYVMRLLEARRTFGARRSRPTPLAPGPGVRTPHDPPVSGLSAATPATERAPDEVGATRLHPRTPGLGQVSAEPVFLKRSRDGEITVQIEARPAMPLKYVLDARMRSVLERVARQATADYGERWSVLAEEDPRGRLRLTRLS